MSEEKQSANGNEQSACAISNQPIRIFLLNNIKNRKTWNHIIAWQHAKFAAALHHATATGKPVLLDE